jgi:TIR domain-containing protein
MPYRNDVFISYRREQYVWTPWARDRFKRVLGSYLQRELGDPARIFIDEQVPVGVNYIEHLAETLAQSKIMVALLSKDYFSSPWCVHELDLMIERAAGNDLIIPVVVHDGEVVPDAVGQLQYADFKKFATPALSESSPLYAEFCEAMAKLAPRIGTAIQSAPIFDAKWLHRFKKRLADVYADKEIAPKNFILKKSLRLKSLPRLKP